MRKMKRKGELAFSPLLFKRGQGPRLPSTAPHDIKMCARLFSLPLFSRGYWQTSMPDPFFSSPPLPFEFPHRPPRDCHTAACVPSFAPFPHWAITRQHNIFFFPSLIAGATHADEKAALLPLYDRYDKNGLRFPPFISLRATFPRQSTRSGPSLFRHLTRIETTCFFFPLLPPTLVRANFSMAGKPDLLVAPFLCSIRQRKVSRAVPLP